MDDDDGLSDEALEAIANLSQRGWHTYAQVVPALVREILRLRKRLRGEMIRQATRDLSVCRGFPTDFPG